MDKVKNFFKDSDKLLACYLSLNVLWIFLGMTLVLYSCLSYSSFSVSLLIFFVFNLFFIGYFYIMELVKFKKFDIFLILLAIFSIISTIFSKNFSVSLFGFIYRYEGVFQLLYYYSLMYLGSMVLSDKNRKIVIGSIIVFGIINVFTGIIQTFDILKFIPIPWRGTKFACGFTSHSNFYGSYMTLCLGLCIGLFLYSNDGKVKTGLKLLLCALFYTGLSLGNALSSVVGLIFIFLLVIVYLVYLIRKRKITKFLSIKHILLVLCLVSINLFLSALGKTGLNGDVQKLTGEVGEVTKGNMSDSFGTGRLFIWKNSLKVVPKYFLHGAGVDSFAYAFGDTPLRRLVKEKTIEQYDKAHNEYLQKTVCEGVFASCTYIGMLFILFIGSIKKILKSNNYITMGLFLSFVGYIVQAIFNISVIEVAPLFWIVIGLLYNRDSGFNKKKVS